MIQARRADEDRVAVRTLQQAVVRDPAERDLREGEPVLLRDDLDLRERIEIRLVPVPDAVRLSLHRVRVKARACLARVLQGPIAPREEPTADCSSRALPQLTPFTTRARERGGGRGREGRANARGLNS